MSTASTSLRTSTSSTESRCPTASSGARSAATSASARSASTRTPPARPAPRSSRSTRRAGSGTRRSTSSLRGRALLHDRRQRARARRRAARLRPRPGAAARRGRARRRTRSCSRSAASREPPTPSRRGRRCSRPCRSAQERWDEAIAIHEEALAEQPDHPALLYNLACMEARAGQHLDALLHLHRAVELEPKWAADARADSDFAPIGASPASPPRLEPVAGQPHAGGERAERGHGIGLRPRDEQHRAEARPPESARRRGAAARPRARRPCAPARRRTGRAPRAARGRRARRRG